MDRNSRLLRPWAEITCDGTKLAACLNAARITHRSMIYVTATIVRYGINNKFFP